MNNPVKVLDELPIYPEFGISERNPVSSLITAYNIFWEVKGPGALVNLSKNLNIANPLI